MEPFSNITAKIFISIIIAGLIGYFIGKQFKSEVITPISEHVKDTVSEETKKESPAATESKKV